LEFLSSFLSDANAVKKRNGWFLREASVSVLEEKFKKALTLG
jgi:hypothetical protein